jgi:hypothetical protein
MVCVRQAWLTLGAQTIQLDSTAAGWACEQLDLGYPTVREVKNNRPDADGIDDRTSLMGERAVTATVHTVDSMSPTAIDAIAASFAPFMVPSARPVLHYVLDRPGAPERTMTLRAAGYSWPIVGAVERQIHLQWVAADPTARDPNGQTAVTYAGASTIGGRGYNLVYPRTYSGGSGSPSSATLTTPGDVTVKPLLRIYGPVTAPVVAFAPGCGVVAFAVTLVVSGGHYVEVDCDARSAYLDGDRTQNVLAQMDWVTLNAQGGWPRIPPATTVTMTMTGQSTSGTTQTQASWNDRYLT